MRELRIAWSLIGAFLVSTAAAADEFIYFGPKGPKRLAIIVTRGTQPPEATWSAAIGSLFAFCDRNNDGDLDTIERSLFVAPTGRSRTRVSLETAGFELAGKLKFEPMNDRVDRVDRPTFERAVKAAGFGPLTLRTIAARSDSANLTIALFKQLDSNTDLHLSHDELAQARTRFSVLDVNEDEWLTTNELLGRGVASANRVQPIPRAESSDDEMATSADWVIVNSSAVKQLLTARGKPRATTLNRRELNMPESMFRKLDRDENGQLDTNELAAWLAEPPHATLTIDLDSAKIVPPIVLDDTRFLIQSPGLVPNFDLMTNTVKTAFLAIAKDGVLEKKAVREQPQLTPFFDFADRNADERLTTAELDALLGLLKAFAAFRVEVVIVDQGRGLFELLDANGDGQLSQRELVNAPIVLKPFANPKGISRESVPRLFSVRPSQRNVLLNSELVGTAPNMAPPMRAKPPVDVPSWFLHMDRNGDGDVSFREFLGPLDRFYQLDRDGDGLIGAEEAKTQR